MDPKYINFAKEFILKAGEMAISGMSEAKVTKTEDSGANVTTNMDQEIEKSFAEAVLANFPEHGFKGEEFKELNRDAEYTWYIDPIDGTKWYKKQVPLWNVTISLVKDGKAVLGIVYNAVAKQMYWAVEGQGFYVNEKRVEFDKQNEGKSTSQVAFDFPLSDKMKDAYEESRNSGADSLHPMIKKYTWQEYVEKTMIQEGLMRIDYYRVRDIGCGAFALSWTANGMFTGFFSPIQHTSKVVDHAAGLLFCREAGVVVDYERLSDNMYRIIAGNQEFIDYIKQKFFEGV
jgi:fructose-1,6-bisphosphatase/inositol monophosphatase family enzyme